MNLHCLGCEIKIWMLDIESLFFCGSFRQKNLLVFRIEVKIGTGLFNFLGNFSRVSFPLNTGLALAYSVVWANFPWSLIQMATFLYLNHEQFYSFPYFLNHFKLNDLSWAIASVSPCLVLLQHHNNNLCHCWMYITNYKGLFRVFMC